jgi:Arc/MetJ-type ribon-helix-helix transcriptional regulator
MVDRGGMVTMSVKVPARMLAKIDALVERGYFLSRAEFIRYAVRKCLEAECYEDKVKPKTSEPEVVYVRVGEER